MVAGDNQISVDFTIKDAKALVALLNIARAQDKVEDGQRKIVSEAKKAEQELEKFARVTTKINATPVEKYNQELQKLDAAVRKNLISQETYNRAVERARGEMQRATLATTQAANTGRQASGSIFPIDKVASYVTGLFTVQAGLQKVGEALQFVKGQSDQALESMQRLEPSRLGLNQVSGSAADLKANNERADAAAAKYGIDRAVARDVLGNLINFGAAEEFETVASARYGFSDLRAAGDVTGRVPKLFGGDVTGKEALNMFLAVANESAINPEDLAQVMPIAAAGVAPLKGGTAEGMAVMGALASKYGRASTEADRVARFGGTAANDPRFAGKGILGTMRMIRDEFSEEERAKYLGSSLELNEGYRYLVELEDEIERYKGLAENARQMSGTEKSELAKLPTKLREGDPYTYAQIERTKASVREEIAREQRLGLTAADSATTRSDIQTELLNRDVGGARRFLADQGAAGAQYLGLGAQGTRISSEVAQLMNPFTAIGALIDKWNATSDALNRAADKFEQAADKTNRGRRQAAAAAPIATGG